MPGKSSSSLTVRGRSASASFTAAVDRKPGGVEQTAAMLADGPLGVRVNAICRTASTRR
jgi:hypothetical protein